VVPDGLDAAGPAARPAVAQGAQPGLDLAADPGGKTVELALRQSSKDGRRSSASTPISASTSATRSTLMPRAPLIGP